jgi:hypothetical protein
MDAYETYIQSFIVRIWVEKSPQSDLPAWSGTVTHVPSGQKYTFKNIAALVVIMINHLQAQGVRVGLFRLIAQWFSRW